MESNEQIEVNPFAYSGLENILDESYEQALCDFDKALELEPDQIIISAYKARLLSNLDRDSEAFDIWKKIVEIKPDWEYAVINKICAQMNIGENKEAIDAFSQFNADNPSSQMINTSTMNQAIAYKNIEDFESAVIACEILKRTGEFNDVSIFWHTWTHSMYASKNFDPVDFGSVSQEGLKYLQNDIDLKSSVALSHFFQNKFSEGIILCDEIIKQDSTDDDTWLIKALNLAGIGDVEKSYESLLVALSIGGTELKNAVLHNEFDIFFKLNDKRFDELISRY